jgi:hypothetical protein
MRCLRMPNTAKPEKRSQIQKFRETARTLGSDESEDRFTATLKTVAKHKGEARAVVHASDCAVHNAPAYEAGPCTCGAIKVEQ